ncbi:MAG TPA: hypothetical protein VHA33_08880 [Candidatus Angelobacter sp.]|nr:hypothetical protein [Candidatus Angelobacter sp.]
MTDDDEESSPAPARLGSFSWQVERDKLVIREKPSQSRSFAGLASARKYNDRPGSRSTLQSWLDTARNPHTQNI